MTTATEAAGTLVALLRQQLAGEPLPDLYSPEADRVAQAMQTLGNRATASDLASIGAAAVQLLGERWTAALQAERLQLQARVSVMRPHEAGPEAQQ